MNQNRQPEGIPTGGQYAASEHADSSVSLTPGAPDAATYGVSMETLTARIAADGDISPQVAERLAGDLVQGGYVTLDPETREFTVVDANPEDTAAGAPPQWVLVCPWCGVQDDIVEVDAAVRWNTIQVTDPDGGYAACGDGDYESDGFLCGRCGKHVDAPESFQINDWT